MADRPLPTVMLYDERDDQPPVPTALPNAEIVGGYVHVMLPQEVAVDGIVVLRAHDGDYFFVRMPVEWARHLGERLRETCGGTTA